MARARYTLADLKKRLRERVGDNDTFWDNQKEYKDAINEAIAVWQALTGEWTTRISVNATSNSPNFYPVPKQIVSLTRVGATPDEAEELTSDILVNIGAYQSPVDRTWYSTGTDVDVYFNAIVSGGIRDYTYDWDFGDGATGSGKDPIHQYSAEGQYTVTLNVTDRIGNTDVATFVLNVLDQVITLSGNPPVEGAVLDPYPCPPSVQVGLFTGGFYNNSQQTCASFGTLRVDVSYNGVDFGEDLGSKYPRWPMKFEFDFGEQNANIEEVYFTDPLSGELLGASGSTFTYTKEGTWYMDNGYYQTSAQGGKWVQDGSYKLWQSPDNATFNPPDLEIGIIVRYREEGFTPFVTLPNPSAGYFSVCVTDGSNKKVCERIDFQYHCNQDNVGAPICANLAVEDGTPIEASDIILGTSQGTTSRYYILGPYGGVPAPVYPFTAPADPVVLVGPRDNTETFVAPPSALTTYAGVNESCRGWDFCVAQVTSVNCGVKPIMILDDDINIGLDAFGNATIFGGDFDDGSVGAFASWRLVLYEQGTTNIVKIDEAAGANPNVTSIALDCNDFNNGPNYDIGLYGYTQDITVFPQWADACPPDGNPIASPGITITDPFSAC
jgi:PKD repeat protein